MLHDAISAVLTQGKEIEREFPTVLKTVRWPTCRSSAVRRTPRSRDARRNRNRPTGPGGDFPDAAGHAKRSLRRGARRKAAVHVRKDRVHRRAQAGNRAQCHDDNQRQHDRVLGRGRAVLGLQKVLHAGNKSVHSMLLSFSRAASQPSFWSKVFQATERGPGPSRCFTRTSEGRGASALSLVPTRHPPSPGRHLSLKETTIRSAPTPIPRCRKSNPSVPRPRPKPRSILLLSDNQGAGLRSASGGYGACDSHIEVVHMHAETAQRADDRHADHGDEHAVLRRGGPVL